MPRLGMSCQVNAFMLDGIEARRVDMKQLLGWMSEAPNRVNSFPR
jgi:hypothetical protein